MDGFGNRGIYSIVEARDFEEIVRERLAETGETAIGAARRAGLPRDAIRSVLRGHPPNLLRATKICDALGLSLSVGSRQTVQRLGRADADDSEDRSSSPGSDLERHTQGLVRAVAAAGGDPIPPEMRTTAPHGPVVRHDSGAAEARRLTEAEAETVVIPFAADVRLSAGSGQPVWDETAEMSVSVARPALASWARPERLRCARVVGDSMAPTIGDGDLVVLDAGRTEPLDGQVFGVHTGEGLVAKRFASRGRQLASRERQSGARIGTRHRRGENPRAGGVDGSTQRRLVHCMAGARLRAPADTVERYSPTAISTIGGSVSTVSIPDRAG